MRPRCTLVNTGRVIQTVRDGAFRLISLLSLTIWTSACLTGNGKNPVDAAFGLGSGDGGIGNSALVFNPGTYSFGNVPLAPSYQDANILVSNLGGKSVYIGSIGGANIAFTIHSSTCPISPVPFTAGDTCSVTVRFSPPSGGSHSMNLTIQYGVSPAESSKMFSMMGLSGSSSSNAPSNFSVTSNTDTQIVFGWTDNSANETGFEIQRCDGSACSGTFTAAATATVGVNVTSYTATGLTNGNYYRFRLRALSGEGNSDWLYGPMSVTFAGLLAGGLDNGTGSATGLASLNCNTAKNGVYVGLSWTHISPATSYLIYNNTSGTPVLLGSVVAPTNNYILTGLTANTNYSLSVQALTAVGTQSYNQALSITTSKVNPCLTLGAPGPSQIGIENGLYDPEGIFSDGTRLFVADRLNHRILIWNSIPTTTNVNPDNVLGQSDLYGNRPNAGGNVSASSLYNPRSVYYDGSKLYVADYSNNRLLIWNSLPAVTQVSATPASTSARTYVASVSGFSVGDFVWFDRVSGVDENKAITAVGANYIEHADLSGGAMASGDNIRKASADVVLGQPTMLTNTSNYGGRNNDSLAGPISVYVAGSKLFVSDYSNLRVLIWNTIPTANRTAADVVVGQANMTAAASGTAVNRFNNQRSVYVTGSTLFVADYSNHRVLGFNPVPTADNASAAFVLGQPDFTTATSGTSATKFNGPIQVSGNGSKLLVTDYSNHRVLVWNSIPGSTNVAADVAVGQPNLTTGSAGTSTIKFSAPIMATVAGSKLLVSEVTNDRVVAFNSIPTANNTAWDYILMGYPSATVVQERYNKSPLSTRFKNPRGGATDGTIVAVADSDNHRVLIWNSMPASHDTAPDVVLGQPDFTANTANNPSRNANTFSNPYGIAICGTKLFVADVSNHRVLMWDTIPTTNQQSADRVLGQANFTSGGAAVAANRMNAPSDVYCDGTRLFVADRGNHRVLIWSNLPTSSGQNADYVLGQANMTSNTANSGGLSDKSLNQPYSVYSTGSKLVVGDYANHRVLIWNSIPTADFTSASVAVGQGNMTSNTANGGGSVDGSVFNGPIYVRGSGSKLIVTDRGNHRVMVWNSVPTTNGAFSDFVLGQANTTSGTGAWDGASANSFLNPWGLFTDGVRIFTLDQGHDRVVGVPFQ